MASLDWKRLANFIIARRTELGMKDRVSMQQRTDISYRTISNLETGVAVSMSTVATVERILGWEPGSASRILEGGSPVLLGQAGSAPPAAYSDPVMQDAWERLADVDLPDSVKRGMISFARAARDEEDRRATG